MSIVAGVLASLALAVFFNSDLGPRWTSPARLGFAVVLMTAAACDALALSAEETVLFVMLSLPALAATIWVSNGLVDSVANLGGSNLAVHASASGQLHRPALREAYFNELVAVTQPAPDAEAPVAKPTPSAAEPLDIEQELRDLLSEKLRRESAEATSLAPIDVPWWMVLDVAPQASMDEVTAQYRSKLKQYHPDRVNGLAPELVQIAEARTKDLNRAFDEAKQEAALPA